MKRISMCRGTRGSRFGRIPLLALASVIALGLLPVSISATNPVPTLRDPGSTSGTYTQVTYRAFGTILNTNPNPGGGLRSSQYNRTAAVAYADQWAHGRNPNYPDFTDNDCTNFNSQNLEAGGLPLQVVNGFLTDDHNWFHNSGIVTYSWSAADHMNQFFSNYQGTLFQFVPDYTGLSAGDVVIYLFPGQLLPDHGGFIVGYGNSSNDSITYPAGTYGLLRDQHSTDKAHIIWDDNVASGTAYYPWHMVY